VKLRKSKRTRQKNKTGDKKGESNDSPKIPDVNGCSQGNRLGEMSGSNLQDKAPGEEIRHPWPPVWGGLGKLCKLCNQIN